MLGVEKSLVAIDQVSNCEILRGLELSWYMACLLCFSCGCFCMLGNSRSNRDLGRLPMRSSAGDTPVVVCGVANMICEEKFGKSVLN